MKKWQRDSLSGQFADWFYLRTGRLATTLIGEVARSAFLNGQMIKIDTSKGTGRKAKVSIRKFEKKSLTA